MKISFYENSEIKQIGLGGNYELIDNEDFNISEFNAIDANGNRKYLYIPNSKDMTCEVVLNSEWEQ